MSEEYTAPNKWLVAFTVMTPTFMVVLDTSVANVSLTHIQGSLSAGLEEVTWVLTSYLTANAIVLPMTAWFASVFGRKRFLMICVAGFTISSFLCGVAPSLVFLIVCRVMQGVFGGGMQPMSQAILLESFPRKQHGTAMAFYGMGIITAPIFGPLIGGYITDHASWRWIFYINVPVGVLSALLVLMVVVDPPYIKREYAKFDLFGIVLLAVGIGSLQMVLDKGNQQDWFNSRFIMALSVMAVVGLITLVWWELFGTREPIVNLRVFKERSFASGNLFLFLTFFGFFSSVVLLPLYLQKLMGYSAFQAGLVLGPGGAATVVMLPIAGIMTQKGHARTILLFGIIFAASSIYLMSGFNLQADFRAVIKPRILQGFAMSFFFIPLTTLTMAQIPKEQMGNATGLYNLMRNVGSSFGVAVSSTLLARRTQFHQFRLIEQVNSFDPNVRNALETFSKYLFLHGTPFSLAQKTALAGFYGQALKQSMMLAFNDTFFVMFIATLSVTPLIFLFRKAEAGSPEKGAY